MPEVSVITPTYNRADVLPRALESVKRQTYRDYEHLVIDDGSTDDTEDVVADYADEVEYIELDRNRGPAAARNRGIEAARGAYVSFLDSDDEYLPHRLEVTVRALDTLPERVGGVFHSVQRVLDNRTRIRSVPDGELALAELADENVIGGLPNTMYRSSVFDRVGGFDGEFVFAEDYEFQLRVCRAFTMVGIDEPLSRVRHDVDGIQDDPRRRRQGLKRLLEKHADTLTDRNVADRYQRIGRACLEVGDDKEARQYFERALERVPPAHRNQTYHAIGRAYLETDHAGKSRRHLAESIRSNPSNYKSHALFVASLLPVDGVRSVETLRYIRDLGASAWPGRTVHQR